MTQEVVGLIPARLHSVRLPRKLLLADTGRPLIQYTWQSATRAKSLADVVVATDSPEIAAAVRGFGGRCELTGDHASGTDRIAEVVRRSFHSAEIVVNVQGDEPELDPAQIDLLVETLRSHPEAQMSTLATPITRREVRDSPSCVKVVCAADGRALYFSRSVIPHVRDGGQGSADRGSNAATAGDLAGFAQPAPWLLHLGLYAYRREYLLKLTQLPVSRLEELEKLEQLRALEAGAHLQVAVVRHHAVGIDTPEDYARFVDRMRAKNPTSDL
ncbi:MAG: 3-deoxy-manno-octulosonate cytidylyltransferase [Planctomycetaceae bacterium]